MAFSTAQAKKKLSNPGERAKISDSQLKSLSPALYQKRVTNKAVATRNALYDPTRLLSGSEIYSLAQTQAKQKYDPQIAQATNDRNLAIANDAALATRVAGYNKMAADQLATSHEAAQTGADSLATKLAGTTSSTLGALDASAAKDQEYAKSDAALRGGDANAGMAGRLAAEFAQQRAGVATTLAAQETAGNSGAAGWTSLIGMMQGAQAMRGADTATQIANQSANREAGLQQGISGLVGQKASAVPENIDALRKSEFEKAAVMQTTSIKQQNADTSATKAANVETTYDKETSKWAAKVGMTPSEYMKLGPSGRAQKIDAYNKKQRASKTGAKDGKLYTSGAFTGYTDKEVASWSQSKRQDAVTAYNKIIHPGKTGTDATGTVNGVKLRTPLEQSKASTTISHTVNGVLPHLKKGTGIENPNFDPKKSESSSNKKYIVDPKKGGYSRAEAARILLADPNSPEPALISAALDMAYNVPPHISDGTAAKLHRAGISVQALGLPSRGKGVQIKSRPPSSGNAGGDPAGRYK